MSEKEGDRGEREGGVVRERWREKLREARKSEKKTRETERNEKQTKEIEREKEGKSRREIVRENQRMSAKKRRDEIKSPQVTISISVFSEPFLN